MAQLQPQLGLELEGIGLHVDESRGMVADQANAAVLEAATSAREAQGALQFARRFLSARHAVDQLEGSAKLSQRGGKCVGAHETTGADHRASLLLRRGPEDDRPVPKLWQRRREIAVAHGGLDDNQGIRFGGNALLHGGAQCRFVHDADRWGEDLVGGDRQRRLDFADDMGGPLGVKPRSLPSKHKNSWFHRIHPCC